MSDDSNNEKNYLKNLENLEKYYKSSIGDLFETLDKQSSELQSIIEKKDIVSKNFDELKQKFDDDFKRMQKENKEYEHAIKNSVPIESKLNDYLKGVSELKNISGEARKVLTEVFKQLIEEQLKVVIKLADSFAKRKDKKQIDKESLNHALTSLSSSDRLLKKAIDLVQKLHF